MYCNLVSDSKKKCMVTAALTEIYTASWFDIWSQEKSMVIAAFSEICADYFVIWLQGKVYDNSYFFWNTCCLLSYESKRKYRGCISALARILKLHIIFERKPIQNCLKWPKMG